MRGANNTTLETISAAATVIASAENRVPQASVQPIQSVHNNTKYAIVNQTSKGKDQSTAEHCQRERETRRRGSEISEEWRQKNFGKRRWASCWSIYWCFGSHKHSKRIGHAVVVPGTVAGAEVPAADYPNQAPVVVLPFIAPPSSPASFLQSEPPSCSQSPSGFLSLTSMSASMYSPGPASMFVIGPYAHETQLVSPPVFSAFPTEPSTAPFTPPPESRQLTTPSSPEVPFARLLDPNHQNNEAVQRLLVPQYEFHSYQLYPGSPVGQLISPSSGISGSGTSSPFTDQEFTPGGPQFLQFQIGNPPKLLNLAKLSAHEWGSQRGSGSLTPDATRPRSRDSFLLDRQKSDVATLPNSFSACRNDETLVQHRVSFEITAEDVVRCMAKEPSLAKAVSPSLENAELSDEKDKNPTEVANCHEEDHLLDTSHDATDHWSFPIVQPGVS